MRRSHGSDSEIYVIEGLFSEDDYMYTYVSPRPFEDKVRILRLSGAIGPTERRPKLVVDRPTIEKLLLEEYPFLTQDDIDPALGRLPQRHGRRAPNSKPDDFSLFHDDSDVGNDDEGPPADASVEIAEFDWNEAEQLLEDHAIHDESVTDFYVKNRQGRWTLEHIGVMADRAAYYAREGGGAEILV